MKREQRFIEVVKNKSLEKFNKKTEITIRRTKELEEFKYLTYVMLLFSVEIHNYNNSYKLLDRGVKSEIEFFKKFLEKYKIIFSKELEEAFETRYNNFREIYQDVFVKNYDEKYEKLVKAMNSCVNAMLIIARQFEFILVRLEERKDYILFLTTLTKFLEEIREKVRPKKVSKYQHYVGVNLKNYKKANIGG
ncbi:MAG: hypothetical protein ACRCX2_27135 [Paraclostridium sp.]